MQGTFLGETVISSACIDKHQQLKMKLPIVFLAVLGVVWGKPLPIASLKEDLKEFLALVPTEKVLDIALDYLANDPEVKEFVVYIQSEEFPPIHKMVEQLKEYKDCFKFINEQGVDVYAIFNEIHDILGYPPYQPTNTTRKGVGFYGLIEDVMTVLPFDDVAALLDKKMETREFFKTLVMESREFLKTLVTFIQSPAFMNMVDTVRNWPAYHEYLEILKEMAVDVERTIEPLRKLFLRGTQQIRDDLKEFMELIPTDKVLEIALDYLANDQEMREFIAYVQSEEFPKIHAIVEYVKKYKDCVKYINEQGVDVYAIINEIHDILGYPPFQPTNTTRKGVGFYGLIDDVIAVLPLDNLKALFEEKMETREYYKILVRILKSPVFVNMANITQNMVNTVRAWPEYHELLEMVREKAVDEDRVIEILWKLSLRGTQSLKKFMEQVPTDKVLEITLDYLANDEEVREFIVKIQSEEFPYIHKTVEHLKEYIYCAKFINEEGVNVYAIINEIHDILGYPPYQPTNTTRMGVGFYGLIDDVIAVLPLNEFFKSLVMETREIFKTLVTETRELYKTLVKFIRSPALMNMVETVIAWPEYQELLEILPEMFVHVEHLWELSLRGTHKLREDVEEFMALVPTEKIILITLDYLANDPELHEIVAYIQSEEFPPIHTIVEYLKEYKDCLKFINDQGVDVSAFILEIYNTLQTYDILGLPPYQPTNTTRTGVGIHGLIDDVVAVLPLNDLKSLFEKKMETRKYFKTLVTVLKSPEFVNMVNTVREVTVHQELLEVLRQKGVDVDRIIEKLRPLFRLNPLHKRRLELLL